MSREPINDPGVWDFVDWLETGAAVMSLEEFLALCPIHRELLREARGIVEARAAERVRLHVEAQARFAEIQRSARAALDRYGGRA